MKSVFRYSLLLIASLSLAACTDDLTPGSGGSSRTAAPDAGIEPTDTGAPDDNPAGSVAMRPVRHDGLERADIDASVISDDGTEITMTIFLPDLEPRQAAPVILHSHGWGGSRLTALSHSGGEGEFIGDAPAEAAFLARERGAIVVSYDQRGFGDSGGNAELMNPEKEGRDFSAVLDFVDTEYRNFIMRSSIGRNPRVGTLGLSYGGGYQWVGGSLDERVDAMVPVATWYDLSYSLHSGDTPKTAWLAVLMGLGVTGSEGNLNDSLYENFARILLPGVDVDDAFLEQISTHGLRAYCEGFNQDAGSIPRADTLIIQGVEDTLFNMNEAVQAFECLRNNGQDSHLIVQRTGHVLPALEQSPGPVGFGTERFLQCGGQQFETSALMADFLDTRLRGHARNLVLPDTCMTVQDRNGIISESIPRGGDLFTPQDQMLAPVDDSLSLLDPLNPDDPENLSADYLERLSPSASLPLFTADRDMNLAGIPLVDLVVDTQLLDPTLFLGLKVSNDDGSTLIHNQVVPMAGVGRKTLELAGVTFPLVAGDQVSLVVYNAHPLYLYNDQTLQSTLNPITLRNLMIELPLQD